MNKSEYTPMMQQYLGIKEKNKESIVFFRLGDFYEMFFDDAILASKELEIALTGRNAGPKEKIPMCGVPHHSADNYIAKLISKGYKVAIVEQTEEATKGKKLVARDVVKVISPGTNLDNKSLDNNFICSIIQEETLYKLAFSDLSTGDIYTTSVSKDIDALLGQLINLQVKEVVLNSKIPYSLVEKLKTELNLMITINDDTTLPSYLSRLTENNADYNDNLSILLNYFTNSQKRDLFHLKTPIEYSSKNYLNIDYHSMQNLELFETLRDRSKKGTLLNFLDKTQTAMGHRLLKQWMLRPLINKNEIISRQQFISELKSDYLFLDDIKDNLRDIYDLDRIIGRISYGNCNARDLLQLSKSLKNIPSIKKSLSLKQSSYSKMLLENISDHKELYTLLSKSLKDELPISIKEGYIFNKGYNQALDEIIDLSENSKSLIQTLELNERKRTQIKNLKIGYTKVFGYYIEVTKANIQHIKDEFGYIRKQTTANAERYITPELKEYEDKILTSKEKRESLEFELFIQLRDHVRTQLKELQHTAHHIAILDSMYSLAKISSEYNFVTPTITDKVINIKDAKHPVIEHVQQKTFTPNDVSINKQNIILITGPNMSGKSTYMRQLALISILTQVGSDVPATSCEIPVFDKIFTRIGSSDDTTRGKSTFMVEMLETNHAIRNATKNSLILFDEIGRGTATYDGMALAQSIIEYVHQNINCVTLFSTHYHELTRLEDTLPKLKNVHVKAIEENNKIIFLHKVHDGASDKSYGINVASLANLPDSLISRAEYILNKVDKKQYKIEDINLFNLEEFQEQNKDSKLVETLKNAAIDDFSPREALNFLYELKSLIK